MTAISVRGHSYVVGWSIRPMTPIPAASEHPARPAGCPVRGNIPVAQPRHIEHTAEED